MSADTRERNVGVAAEPLVGPANTKFAAILSRVAVTAPVEAELLNTTPSPVKLVTPLPLTAVVTNAVVARVVLLVPAV
jgi:hypothetical protein